MKYDGLFFLPASTAVDVVRTKLYLVGPAELFGLVLPEGSILLLDFLVGQFVTCFALHLGPVVAQFGLGLDARHQRRYHHYHRD